MNKNRLKILPLVVVATLLVGLCTPFGWAKRDARDLNVLARRAKAAALADMSASIEKHADLAAHVAAQRARSQNPTDTAIILWDNMLRLYSRTPNKAVYDEQLKILTESSSSPIDHYPTVIVLSKRYEPDDTLKAYSLSRLAHERHPENSYIGTYALKRGIEVASSYRFNTEGDTIPMTPKQTEFVRSLVDFADTLISQYGRNPDIDMHKAQLFYILNDTVAIRALADRMYINDADDPATLNALVNIFTAITDTARVVELGMRSLELEPSPDPVQRMFSLASSPDDMERLRNTVMATAENTMLEPELRATILNAAITGLTEREPILNLLFYDLDDGALDIPDSPDSTQTINPADEAFIVRVDSMAREMIAEEPDNYPIIRYMATFGKSPAWLYKYGVDYLLDFAAANPDNDDANSTSIQILVENDVCPPGRSEKIYTVLDTLTAHSPESSLFITLNKATFAINYDDKAKAYALLDTMTYAGTLDMFRRSLDSSSEDDIEESAKNQWIKILTIKSDLESQLNNPEAAMSTLRRILVIKPDDPMVLNNLGYIMAENGGDLHEAMDLINRSLELASENANTIDSKAWIQYLMHDYDEALATLELFFTVINLPIEKISGVKPSTLSDTTATSDQSDSSDQTDSSVSIFDTLREHNINPEAIGPIIAHLLAIYDALDMDEAALNTYRAASELIPDDEIVVKFKKDHKL